MTGRQTRRSNYWRRRSSPSSEREFWRNAGCTTAKRLPSVIRLSVGPSTRPEGRDPSMTDPSSRQFRERSIRRALLYVAIGATLATLVISAAQLVKSGTNTSLPAADAQRSHPDPPTPTQQSQAPFATDEHGFINSSARCDDTQIADAVGRTDRSLVVICVASDGKYEYRGVRLSDNAGLRVAAEPTAEGGFVARNEGVTYAVSPTQLLVTSGETVLFRESMTEFHAPRLPAESGPPAPPPPTTTPAR